MNYLEIPSGVNGDPWLTVIYDLRYLKDEWMLNLLRSTKYFCFRAHMIRNNEEMTRFIDYIETPYITILTSEFTIDDLLYQRIRNKITPNHQPDMIIWSDYRIKNIEDIDFNKTFSSNIVFKTNIVKEAIHTLKHYDIDILPLYSCFISKSFENVILRNILIHENQLQFTTDNLKILNKLISVDSNNKLLNNILEFEKKVVKNDLYKLNYNELPIKLFINAIDIENISFAEIFKQKYLPEEIHIITNNYSSEYSKLQNVFLHFNNEIYDEIIKCSNKNNVVLYIDYSAINHLENDMFIYEIYNKYLSNNNSYCEQCLEYKDFIIPNKKYPVIFKPNAFKFTPSNSIKDLTKFDQLTGLTYCLRNKISTDTVSNISFETNEDDIPLSLIAIKNLVL